MFPGNVVRLAWHAKPVIAMFGRLAWADGRPVANAVIQAGDEAAASDESGFFQIEVANGVAMTARTGDGRVCEARLNPRIVESYGNLGVVTCATALPKLRMAQVTPR